MFVHTHTHTHIIHILTHAYTHSLTLTHPQLSCDSDSNVRYGTELLDRLMKDVVSENPHFDIDNFIVLLRDRIYTRDGFARQFLVSWVSPCSL